MLRDSICGCDLDRRVAAGGVWWDIAVGAGVGGWMVDADVHASHRDCVEKGKHVRAVRGTTRRVGWRV